MHIHEIIVDGFKSYARRTVIAGFDPHFNAITGLNGSGKSNILDSICFVLGITNLSQVRAGNLSELIYKQGQAGVTKASVTIVFNNHDESSSPVGYESCKEVTVTRQVLLGGKSKYLINGRNSPAAQVSNLFHSVQLNVNNPHFLIMQGRITKVLNMKPDEILGMVEEAAGTRMYETKRVAAIKTIEKKQTKLDELNTILSEEITPTLERLRGEKQNYLKWSKNNADIERIERFVVAYDYCKAQESLSKHEEQVSDMQNELNRNEDIISTLREEMILKDEDIERISSKLKGEFGDQHKKTKKAEEALSKDLVKATSTWQNSVQSMNNAADDLEAARSLVHETKELLNSKENEIKKDNEHVTKTQLAASEAEKEVNRLTKEYQTMCAGMSSSENSDSMTLPDQISKAHSDANNADARIKQANLKIEHLTKSIKGVEKEMRTEEKSIETISSKKIQVTDKVEQLKKKLSFINFSPSEFDSLESEKHELDKDVSNLHEIVDTLSAQLQGRLSFNYSDPVRGFDRSKVKGMVANLIQVKNSNHATALEVVAGGKLYQIVVDEAITGKALLSRGQLKSRVTIIPLDKITPQRVTNKATEQAKTIATNLGASASPAIELVGFGEEVRNAIEYVFGSALVVDTMDAANKICEATRTRTVTLDGDVYDPSGTISGGSKNNLGSTLSKLTELSEANLTLEKKKDRLKQVNTSLKDMNATRKKYEEVIDSLEIANAELASIEKHLSQTTYGMVSKKYSDMKKEINDAHLQIEEMEEEKTRKWALYHELKDKELELTINRESKLKFLEQNIEKAKRSSADKTNTARQAKVHSQKLSMELESLNGEFSASQAAVIAAEKALREAKTEESDLQMAMGEIKSRYDNEKALLDDIEKQMMTSTSELTQLNKAKSSISKKIENAELEIKKISIKLNKCEKDVVAAEKFVTSIVKKFPWIDAEKHSFGEKGGDYDFGSSNPSSMNQHLKDLQSEQTGLAKKINKKVMGMIEKAEGEYSELQRKRKVVLNDKKKIQAVIEELDEKKKSELERTWVKVNRDFGSIFSTLLPGTSAKLEPPEGKQAWEGLEVKVAFGGVWKQSLTELSGGQRSLLALSLILAMLLFKPAPMYILDEVDAALDLSHTQNIGNMLKTHFSQSQFIVVSLKEGMFNNANVIFRTNFVDGVSTVTRTLGVGASVRARALAEQTNENRQPRNIEKTPSSKRRVGDSRVYSARRPVGKEN